MSRLLLTGSLVVLMSLSSLAAEEKDKPVKPDHPVARVSDAQPAATPWWVGSADEPRKPIDAKKAVKPPTRVPPPVFAQPPHNVPPLPHGPSSPSQYDPYPTPRPQYATPQLYRATPPAKQQREIYRVKHLPASDLATAINEVLRAQQAATRTAAAESITVIVPEVITNSLVINGAESGVKSAIELAEQLDVQPKMVQVRVLLVEIHAPDDDAKAVGGLLARLSDADGDEDFDEVTAAIAELPGLRLLGGPQLTLLDNQPGFLQVGQRVPRITGASVSSRGRTNNVELENVGLILAATARINDDGLVTMEVDLEKSQLGPADEGAVLAEMEGEDPIRAAQVETLTCQTTIAVRDGQVCVLGGLASRESEMVILISPRIVEP